MKSSTNMFLKFILALVNFFVGLFYFFVGDLTGGIIKKAGPRVNPIEKIRSVAYGAKAWLYRHFALLRIDSWALA